MAWAAIVSMIKQGVGDTLTGISKPAAEWSKAKNETIAAQSGGTIDRSTKEGGGILGDLLGSVGGIGGVKNLIGGSGGSAGSALGSSAGSSGLGFSGAGSAGMSEGSSFISSLSDEKAKTNVTSSNGASSKQLQDTAAALKATGQAIKGVSKPFAGYVAGKTGTSLGKEEDKTSLASDIVEKQAALQKQQEEFNKKTSEQESTPSETSDKNMKDNIRTSYSIMRENVKQITKRK